MENTLKVFPDYFTQDIINEIIENGGQEHSYHVYRVDKYGNMDKTAFYNYYDEVVSGLKTVRNKEKKLKNYQKSIGALSVSCQQSYDQIIYYYSVTLRNKHPHKRVLEGDINPEDGLSRITAEWEKSATKGHIDWWLYKNADPSAYFKEVQIPDE